MNFMNFHFELLSYGISVVWNIHQCLTAWFAGWLGRHAENFSLNNFNVVDFLDQ